MLVFERSSVDISTRPAIEWSAFKGNLEGALRDKHRATGAAPLAGSIRALVEGAHLTARVELEDGIRVVHLAGELDGAAGPIRDRGLSRWRPPVCMRRSERADLHGLRRLSMPACRGTRTAATRRFVGVAECAQCAASPAGDAWPSAWLNRMFRWRGAAPRRHASGLCPNLGAKAGRERARLS